MDNDTMEIKTFIVVIVASFKNVQRADSYNTSLRQWSYFVSCFYHDIAPSDLHTIVDYIWYQA